MFTGAPSTHGRLSSPDVLISRPPVQLLRRRLLLVTVPLEMLQPASPGSAFTWTAGLTGHSARNMFARAFTKRLPYLSRSSENIIEQRNGDVRWRFHRAARHEQKPRHRVIKSNIMNILQKMITRPFCGDCKARWMGNILLTVGSVTQ